MSFSLSPAVIVQEIDSSLVVSNQASTLSAFAGKFIWGAVNEPRLIANEDQLVKTFGVPSPDVATSIDFLVINSFFGYSSGAWVTRIGNKSMQNAITNLTKEKFTDKVTILNRNEYANIKNSGLNKVAFCAKYAGSLGNSIQIAVASSEQAYSIDLSSVADVFTIDYATTATKRNRTLNFNYTKSDTDKEEIRKYMNVDDILVIDTLRYTIVEIDTTAKTILLDRVYIGGKIPTTQYRLWKFADEFSGAPIENTFHLVVYSENSVLSKDLILETFDYLSTDSKQSNFYKTQIERKSDYLYAGNITPDPLAKVAYDVKLVNGNDGVDIGTDEYITGYSFYQNADTYDTPLLITGNAITDNSESGAILADFITHSIAEQRKDTVVFISPPLDCVLDNSGKEAQDSVTAIKRLQSSSYAFVDSGWVYVYDRYNDRQVAIPLNGHMAGLCALTDYNRDVWVSPAGIVRGVLRNIVKLVYNPSKIDRDLLYSNSINPVVTLPNGTSALYGDKTLLRQNTALSRLNVRRLLIVLEKNIATAAASLLFESNDEFTQRRFVSMVEPILKDAKGRRGLSEYRIVADSSVNTTSVIENNGFVGQIYIKPLYSINSVKLQFVVVNASASFDEVIGAY